MTTKVIDDLAALIVRELKIDPADIKPETPLFEGGLELDSFAVVDLISRVEAQFDIQLADADFRAENFTDIGTLSGVIASYVDAKV